MRPVSAINRFGWGQREASDAGIPVQDWLAQQLTGPDTAVFRGVSPCAEGLIALREQRRNKLQGDPLVKPIFLAEIATQMDTLLLTEQPFRERLVWFWFNHFTVMLIFVEN